MKRNTTRLTDGAMDSEMLPRSVERPREELGTEASSDLHEAA